jgi:phage/plasmid-like protein (TIGR03299 family)
MSANIDTSNSQDNIAFLGSRNDIWHRMGQEMPVGASIAVWAQKAGLAHTCSLAPIYTNINGELRAIEERRAIVRDDTFATLGVASPSYRIHQPSEMLDFFARQIEVDDRFALDVAGALDGGRKIWATAKFNGDIKVAGDAHKARLLFTTAYDTTAASIAKMSLTRTVCENTLAIALSDGFDAIRTTHRSVLDIAAVAKKLAAAAQSVTQFKAIGDALALNEMGREEVSEFFKTLLDIPFDQPKDETSTRKLNQFAALNQAYRTTVTERNGDRDNAFVALQAATRYVDHDRSAKDDGARFASANFGGGGERLKGQAMQLLMPRIKDKVLIAA